MIKINGKIGRVLISFLVMIIISFAQRRRRTSEQKQPMHLCRLVSLQYPLYSFNSGANMNDKLRGC